MAMRKWNALLTLLAIIAAVALYVALHTLGAASARETSRLMRDLGFNLRIIPAATNDLTFLRLGFSPDTMPEAYVQEFTKQEGLSYRHLLATLQQYITIDNNEVLLTGITSEVSPPDVEEKKPMIFDITPGSVYLGFHVAQDLGKSKGDTLDIRGETFNVEQTLQEQGNLEDARVYAHLDDVQRILNLEDQINEIQALECLCYDPNVESIDLLREQLEKLLPDTKVIQLRALAKAREKQRIMTETYMQLIVRVLALAAALWVAVLTLLNVNARKQEIGILRALGFGTVSIGALFIGKLLLLGMVGALVGYGAGTLFALQYGPAIFQVTANAIVPDYTLLGYALVLAPLFAAACAALPTAIAITQDPVTNLREE
jgi:putative ABC transport system permease protein